MAITKKNALKQAYNIFLVILGTIIISFGAIVFLEPFQLVTGGISGISILFERLSSDPDTQILIYNISTASITILLFILGAITLGKEFTVKTLISTIVYPLANFAFSYIPGLSFWIKEVITSIQGGQEIGNYLLSGIFGGVCVGSGVSLTFLGGGSSGGVDVFAILAHKYLHIKQSLASFIVDATIIGVGLFVLPLSHLPYGLVGIISAFVTASLIDAIYVSSQAHYQADIVSDKWEEIRDYIVKDMDRGCTLIHAKGGFSNRDRIIVRIVFDKKEYSSIREQITKLDPNAFVSYTSTNAVFGRGFTAAKEYTNGK